LIRHRTPEALRATKARYNLDVGIRERVDLVSQSGYCLFETALGWCGIAWCESDGRPAVTALALPEAVRTMTERRVAKRSGAHQPRTPPPEIAQTVERLCRHMGGEVQDFRDIAIDLEGVDPFARQVYAAAREIPAGETRTYGEIAKALNHSDAAPAVGQALAKNRIPLIIPCHRVLAAGGKAGGFSAYGGLATKAKLLAIEGAAFGRLRGQRSFEFPTGSPRS